MQISIGADELILWLRKNDKAVGAENMVLGRRIFDLVSGLGGQLIRENHASVWADDLSDEAMERHGIPKTSGQYKIDTALLPSIFEELSKWW
jgi:hypothetical protein